MPSADANWTVDQINTAASNILMEIWKARDKVINDLSLNLGSFKNQLKAELMGELKTCIKAETQAVLAQSPAMQGLDASQIADMLWERLLERFFDNGI